MHHFHKQEVPQTHIIAWGGQTNPQDTAWIEKPKKQSKVKQKIHNKIHDTLLTFRKIHNQFYYTCSIKWVTGA